MVDASFFAFPLLFLCFFFKKFLTFLPGRVVYGSLPQPRKKKRPRPLIQMDMNKWHPFHPSSIISLLSRHPKDLGPSPEERNTCLTDRFRGWAGGRVGW
ncbi:hypothetical protein F4775DRAFT_539403 [Biscogniauxia sp. FL1348]|nr:hypothetical protein F4775DRAFT_539403 [Biscogniauxia sp. FL1348]